MVWRCDDVMMINGLGTEQECSHTKHYGSGLTPHHCVCVRVAALRHQMAETNANEDCCRDKRWMASSMLQECYTVVHSVGLCVCGEGTGSEKVLKLLKWIG